MAPQPTGLSDWDTPSARTTMQQRGTRARRDARAPSTHASMGRGVAGARARVGARAWHTSRADERIFGCAPDGGFVGVCRAPTPDGRGEPWACGEHVRAPSPPHATHWQCAPWAVRERQPEPQALFAQRSCVDGRRQSGRCSPCARARGVGRKSATRDRGRERRVSQRKTRAPSRVCGTWMRATGRDGVVGHTFCTCTSRARAFE